MSFFRIVMCALCLFAVGVTLAAAGDKDYKELYRRGVECNKKGEIDEAIRWYSKAIALKPDSAALFFVRGRAYVQNKHYENAVSDLGKAIVLKPDYAEAYNIRGVAYVGKSRKQLATADFKKACSMGLREACSNLK
jgi:tetratricopeptide (TPR) repeat protein